MDRKLVLALILLLSGWMALCVFSEYYFLRRVEKDLNISISGNWRPSPVVPRATIHDASFVWNDRVRFISGDLTYVLFPMELFNSHSLRVKVFSNQAHIEFLGGWANLYGNRKVHLDSILLDVVLKDGEIKDIYAVDVYGEGFEFKLNSGKRSR